jgi:hypothetical protein
MDLRFRGGYGPLPIYQLVIFKFVSSYLLPHASRLFYLNLSSIVLA